MMGRLLRPPRLARSPGWWRAFLAGFLLCAAAAAVERVLGAPGGAAAWTTGYGIAAAALLVAALAYSGRRRAPRRGPGGAWHWVQLHVYGGTLFLLLLAMHGGGGGPPAGALAWGLWASSVWVVATGLAGVVIQKWAPAVLTSGLTTEVHYDRIPDLVGAVRDRVGKLAAASGDAVRNFHDAHVAAALAAPETRLAYFVDVTGGIEARMRPFDHLRRALEPDDAERVDEMRTLVRTKLEMDAHYTVQKALRWWLYAHAPAALLLAALVAFHVFAVLRY